MAKSIKKALEHLSNQTEWCIEPERLSGVIIDRSRQREIIDQALKEIEAIMQQEIVKAKIDEVYRLDGGDEDWQMYHDERTAELRSQIQDKEDKNE